MQDYDYERSININNKFVIMNKETVSVIRVPIIFNMKVHSDMARGGGWWMIDRESWRWKMSIDQWMLLPTE